MSANQLEGEISLDGYDSHTEVEISQCDKGTLR